MMNKTFEFADKFGYKSLFLTEEEDNIIQNIEKTPIKIIFYPSFNKYKQKGGTPSEANSLYLYVFDNPKVTHQKSKVKALSDSGLSFYDLLPIYGLGLGKNLVKAVRKDSKNAKLIVDRLINFLEINTSRYDGYRVNFLWRVNNFVDTYPRDEDVLGNSELFKIFQQCLRLGLIDISNTAETLAKEVFFAIAEEIRDLQLGEAFWNPDVATIKYEEKTSDDAKYTPLLGSFKTLKNDLNEAFSKLLFNTEPVSVIYNNEEQLKPEIILDNIAKDTRAAVDRILRWFAQFIQNAFTGVTSKLESVLQQYNAFLVGLINGLIELIASIVEAIGVLFSLLNYESLSQFVEGIKNFINNFNWATFKQLIWKELKALFSFIDGDEMYKNAYEFGTFIPKIFELVLDAIGLVKGAAKLAKSIVEMTQKFSKLLKASNEALQDLVKQLRLLGIDKSVLKRLEQKGIKIEARLIPNQSLNSSIGIPIKLYDGKRYTIWYEDVKLKRFKEEKDANAYLKKLDKDKKFLEEEIAISKKLKIQIQRTSFRSKNAIFKEIDDWFIENRSRFMQGDDLDYERVKVDWNASKNIVKKELLGDELKELSKLKNSTNFLKNKNVAKAKIEIEINGNSFEFDYIEHAGVGSKIEGSKGTPIGRNIKKSEFTDSELKETRLLDSEGKIIELINEDTAKLATDLGLKAQDIKVKRIILYTTYDPCNVCKKELLLLQEHYRTTIEVFRPFYFDKKGNKKVVTNNKTFNKI